MIYKERKIPKELQIMRALNKRMLLSKEDAGYLNSLEKGWQGEQVFDRLTERLSERCLVLNDLLFSVSRTTFQIDSLVIAEKALMLYEVKNYEGAYFYGDKQFKQVNTNREVISPLLQLSRSKILLQQFIRNLGYTIPVQASVAFVNPNFILYYLPPDQEVLMPNRLEDHLKQLDKESSKLTNTHYQLAKKLSGAHQTSSPYSAAPDFRSEDLKKGLYCGKCRNLIKMETQRRCVCRICGYEELSSQMVVRHIEEFKLLFPHKRLKPAVIRDWTGNQLSAYKIRSALAKI